MENAEQFAKRFLKNASALENVDLRSENINTTIWKGVMLVVETESSRILMGKYAPCEQRKNYPYWLVLAPCIVKDSAGERKVERYKIDFDAVEKLSYVRAIV